MTFIACRAEIALVRVVSGMTRIACGRLRNLVDIFLDVAKAAGQLFVSAGQRELRLFRMIESPQLPPVRVVARRAIRTQTALVMGVLVAGRTLG